MSRDGLVQENFVQSSLQAGSGIVSNVPAVVTFSPAFASAPAVVVGCTASGAIFPYVSGTVSAGSVSVQGVSGLPFTWIANGTV